MSKLKQAGIVFLQYTWGVLQTFVGTIVFLITLLCGCRHIWLNGSVITEIRGNWGGITLGMFAFVDYMPAGDRAKQYNLVLHEYGHTIQSYMLGPLWIFIIGIPSLIWAGFFESYRIKNNVSYYSFYPEKWANKLGGAYKYLEE